MRFLRLLTVLLISGLLAGCVQAAQKPQDIKSQGITQPEAQALFDGVREAFGDYDEDIRFRGQIDERRSSVASATLVAFDLKSILLGSWSEDIRERVLSANPTAFRTGEDDDARYAEANKEFRNEVLAALSDVSSEDIFHDAWFLMLLGPNAEQGYLEEPRLPELNPRTHLVLWDAVFSPSLDTKRVVAVEGTNTVVVTMKKDMTFGYTPNEEEWTFRYSVERRGNGWVITDANLGDYFVAVAEADLKRAEELADKAKAEPTRDEFKAAVGKNHEVMWFGQDKKGRWWVLGTGHIDELQEVYSTLGFKDVNNEWVMSGDGLSNGAVDYDNITFDVPSEIRAAVEKVDTWPWD